MTEPLNEQALRDARNAAFAVRENGVIDFDAAIATAITTYLAAAPQPGWREITEEDRPPNDTDVLMGCWQTWPEAIWLVEYGHYGSTKGGWIHGRMTHWLPSSILPAAPAGDAQEGGR